MRGLQQRQSRPGESARMEASNYRTYHSVLALGSLARRQLERMAWLPPLLTRLFVGYFFLETGWGKIHNLDGFIQRFVQWGIPWPGFLAPLSAYTELVGGALTVVGLGTRLVSIPMIINMIVAIVSVNFKHVFGLDDFVELDEPLYALVYFWLMISGPGCVSLDYLVARLFPSVRRRLGENATTVVHVQHKSKRVEP
jgi:putative oxidoreductase